MSGCSWKISGGPFQGPWRLVSELGHVAATVWDDGTWYTWNPAGVGGYNGKQFTVEQAKKVAEEAAKDQGFLPQTPEASTEQCICLDCGSPYTPNDPLILQQCQLCELKEIKETHRDIINEVCAGDEKHCPCVPSLRAEITRLRKALADKEETKEPL